MTPTATIINFIINIIIPTVLNALFKCSIKFYVWPSKYRHPTAKKRLSYSMCSYSTISMGGGGGGGGSAAVFIQWAVDSFYKWIVIRFLAADAVAIMWLHMGITIRHEWTSYVLGTCQLSSRTIFKSKSCVGNTSIGQELWPGKQPLRCNRMPECACW